MRGIVKGCKLDTSTSWAAASGNWGSRAGSGVEALEDARGPRREQTVLKRVMPKADGFQRVHSKQEHSPRRWLWAQRDSGFLASCFPPSTRRM